MNVDGTITDKFTTLAMVAQDKKGKVTSKYASVNRWFVRCNMFSLTPLSVLMILCFIIIFFLNETNQNRSPIK